MAASEPQEENKTPQDPRSMTPGQRLAAQKEAKAKRKAAQRGAQGETAAQLVENVGRASSWANENKGLIWAVVLAIVVISVGLTAWRIQSQQASAAASSVLAEASDTMLAPLEGEADADAEGEQTFQTADARAKAALKQYREVISGHPDSPAARWARAGEGHALLALEKDAEALEAFEKVDTDQTARVELKLRALEGQGFALEAQDKLAEAEERFAAIEKLGDGEYAPLGAYHVGRMALARGEKERAIEAFTKVMEALDRVEEEEEEEVLQLSYVEEQAKQRLLELEPSVVADKPGQAGMNFPGAENLPPELMQKLQKAAKSAPSSGSGAAQE